VCVWEKLLKFFFIISSCFEKLTRTAPTLHYILNAIVCAVVFISHTDFNIEGLRQQRNDFNVIYTHTHTMEDETDKLKLECKVSLEFIHYLQF